MNLRSSAPARLVGAILLGFVSLPAFAHSGGTVRGVVRDEQRSGLAGATVLLEDDHGSVLRTVTAGDSGAFELQDIPPGEYTLDALSPGRYADRKVVQVRMGEEVAVDLDCEVAPVVHQRIYVSAVRAEPQVAPPARSTSTSTTIDRQTIANLPMGQDRPIEQVITTQPGFNLDAGNVSARGRYGGSLRYRIDHVPVPESVGAALLAQTIPTRMIDSMEIYAGAMPAEIGNSVGGVVDLAMRRGTAPSDGLAEVRYGSYQTVEPSLTYARMLGRLAVSIGGSFLHSQRALDPPAIDPILHDTGYRGSAFLRLDYKASERDRFELFGFYVANAYQIPIDPTAIPASMNPMPDRYGNAPPPFIPRDTDAMEREHEAFVAFSWVHSFGPRGELQVSPYYKLSYGALDSDPVHALGPTADAGSTASNATRLGQHSGVVAYYTLARGGHLAQAGVELDALFGHIDFTEWHRDDMNGGIDPTMTTSGTDGISAVRWSGFVQDRWERGRFTLTAGLRADGYHYALPGGQTADEAGASPRVGLSVLLGRRLSLRAAVGLGWLAPPLLDAGTAARIHGDVADGVVYDLKPETDAYGEIGLDVVAARWLKLVVGGWGRWVWNQLDDNVIGTSGLLGYYNYARGRAVGVDGAAHVVLRRWLTGFANFEWEVAQGQHIITSKYIFEADELASRAWESLDESQQWTVNVGATLRAGSAFASLLMNYGSGLRTGNQNTQHVPEHVRFDVTLEKSFDEVPLRPRLAVDLINLFDWHYAYRIANGFFGSTWAPPREVFVRLAIPLGPAKR
jgi:hypothetical protein